MDIQSLGHSSYRIRGKSATIVTDPFDGSMTGFPFPKHVSATVVTVSHAHEDHNATAQIEDHPFIISGAGEYEIGGVSVIGIPSYHDTAKGSKRGKNIIYRIEVDGVAIVHMGDVGTMLTTEEIDILDGVDILLVPVGGDVTIPLSDVRNLISEIEPSVVIPMHYRSAKHNPKIFGNLAPLSEFLKLMGKDGILPVPKLTISKDKLPEEMQVIVLE